MDERNAAIVKRKLQQDVKIAMLACMQNALKITLVNIRVQIFAKDISMMSLYEGLRTKVRSGSGLLEEFGVSVGAHQRSVLLPLTFAIVVDVATKDARKRS